MAEKRFRALRVLATLVKVLAVLVLLAGLVSGSLMIGMATVGAGALGDALGGMAGDVPAGIPAAAGGIVVILVSVVYFVLLFGAAEALYLLLAVEESSRRTADLMGQMWETFGPPRRAGGIQPLAPEP
jgi:hypothetical protein